MSINSGEYSIVFLDTDSSLPQAAPIENPSFWRGRCFQVWSQNACSRIPCVFFILGNLSLFFAMGIIVFSKPCKAEDDSCNIWSSIAFGALLFGVNAASCAMCCIKDKNNLK